MAHEGIPPALWTTECPFRSFKHPQVRPYLELFFTFRRFDKQLPRAGGLDDQDNRVMMAFEALTIALGYPLVARVAPPSKTARRNGRSRG